MEIFKSENIITFFDRFKTDMDCLEYLAEKKWSLGFTCEKCKHNKCTIRKKNLARDCNKCHHIESPTAGTLFHKVKFGLRKSFFMHFFKLRFQPVLLEKFRLTSYTYSLTEIFSNFNEI